VIAIDGPAGSGKTTIASLLADYLGAIYLDTGMLYRAATILAHRQGLTADDGAKLAALINNGKISLESAAIPSGRSLAVTVDGEDVSDQLRTPEIDRTVSAISAIPEVRAALLPIQRQFAVDRRVIMAGRDIATVVFPDAGVQIYLDASLEERARRRWLELRTQGSDLTIEQVKADLERRDSIDSNRAHAPLTRADEATHVQTDGKSISDVVTEVAAIAEAAY
jgi:cytidylate kinase